MEKVFDDRVLFFNTLGQRDRHSMGLLDIMSRDFSRLRLHSRRLHDTQNP
jgi:hypothetical protein